MSLRSKMQDMMLRERPRTVSTKKELMTDTTSPSTPVPASFSSRSPLEGYTSKSSMDSGAALSPRAMLETKPFSTIVNLLSPNSCKTKPFLLEAAAATTHSPSGSSRAIGLGLVGALSNEEFGDTGCRMVVFGSQLKNQTLSPRPSIELSSETKNSQMSPIESGNLVPDAVASPRLLCMSPSEIELSEDYTCVISHGPNPKKTHIFDNCIIESCDNGFLTSNKESKYSNNQSCHDSCEKDPEKGKGNCI